MSKSILLATILIELLCGVCRFIAMHLRAEAKSRRLRDLPRWELLPWKWEDLDVKVNSSSFKVDKGVIPPKIRKPRSRLR